MIGFCKAIRSYNLGKLVAVIANLFIRSRHIHISKMEQKHGFRGTSQKGLLLRGIPTYIFFNLLVVKS